MIETTFSWVIGAVLFASALLTLWRVVRGPSVLDRVVGTEVLISTIVCALGALVALRPGSTTLPLLISLSLVGFVASVAVARFVARDRDYPVKFGAGTNFVDDRPGQQPRPENLGAAGDVGRTDGRRLDDRGVDWQGRQRS